MPAKTPPGSQEASGCTETIKERDMKQQSTSPRSLARPAALLMAALVLGLTYASVARAAVTIQVPNHSETIFGVPAAGVTGNIGLPIFNSPITISGTTTTVGFRGTGFVHL